MRSAMAMATVFLGVGSFVAHANYSNVTGQPQATSGRGPSNPGNPGEGDKPSLPGDQPRKAGTDAGNPVNPRAGSPVNSKNSNDKKR
jgi:hypothetical protein